MITDQTPKAVFSGNDSTTAFPFSFRVDSAAELVLVLKDTDGVFSELASNFTLTLNADQEADPGGSIAYPLTGDELATGEKLVAYRETDPTQDVDLETLGELDLDNIESMADKLQKQIQEINATLVRTVKFPLDETPTADDSDTFLEHIDDAQAAAEAAQAAAETAQAAAAASATASSGSATSSSSSAAAAAVSAAAAAASAAAASASAASAAAAATAALAAQQQSGLFAAKPAAPVTRVEYYSTDNDCLEVWRPEAGRWFLIG